MKELADVKDPSKMAGERRRIQSRIWHAPVSYPNPPTGASAYAVRVFESCVDPFPPVREGLASNFLAERARRVVS